MKLAIISDIHANLPALEATLLDVEEQAPDLIYCLGDLVGYAPWPNEVVAELRRRRITTIAGNYEKGVGLAYSDCGCAYRTDEERALWTALDRLHESRGHGGDARLAAGASAARDDRHWP